MQFSTQTNSVPHLANWLICQWEQELDDDNNHPVILWLYAYLTLQISQSDIIGFVRSVNCITDYCGSLKCFVFIVHMGADSTAACENEVHCPSVLRQKQTLKPTVNR